MENLRGWPGKSFRDGLTSTEPLLKKNVEFSQPFREACDEGKKMYIFFAMCTTEETTTECYVINATQQIRYHAHQLAISLLTG